MKEKEEKDGLTHVHMGLGYFALCGARVACLMTEFDGERFVHHARPKEVIQDSAGEDDLDRVTCPLCMAFTARLVRAYRKATRGRTKWSERLR